MSFLLGILGKVFDSLLGGIVDWAREKRAEAAQREVGRLEQKTVDQQAAIDAQKRMQDAAAKPVDTARDLADGKF